MELKSEKNVFLLVGTLAVIQTFFMIVMGGLIAFESPRWVMLIVLTIFSMVNLGVNLAMGNIVVRLADNMKRIVGQMEKMTARLRTRPGLLDLPTFPFGDKPEQNPTGNPSQS